MLKVSIVLFIEIFGLGGLFLGVSIELIICSLLATNIILVLFLRKSLRSVKISGEVLNKEKYQQRHLDLFGDYLKIVDLSFSEKVFDYPLFVWEADENLIFEQLLKEIRKKKIPTVIFDQGTEWYNNFSNMQDVWINFSSQEKGVSWDFVSDFKNNPKIIRYFEQNSCCDCSEYLRWFKLKSKDKDTKSFLDKFCFSPTDNVAMLLKEIIPNFYEPNISHIRNSLAREYNYLALFSKAVGNKEIASICDKAIVWVENYNTDISKFIFETIPDDRLCIVHNKNSGDIKRSKTIVINFNLEEFYIRLDGSYLSFSRNNKKVAELFGLTTVRDIKLFGHKYNNLNYPAITNKDLDDVLFNYYNQNDILRISK